MQVEKFLENIKHAGRNRHAGGKFSGKSINVQGGNFLTKSMILQVILIFETEKVIVKFILTFLLRYLSHLSLLNKIVSSF